MKCDQAKLVDFLNGQLPPDEMEAILSHFESCPACEEAFQDLLRIRAMAPEIKAGLSADFFRFGEHARPPWRAILMYGGATALVIALVAGLFVMRAYILQQTPASLEGLLENQPYTYVAPVMRGEPAPPDPAREAMMALYEKGDYPAFIEAASDWLGHHRDDHRLMFFAGVAAYLAHSYGAAEIYLQWSIETEGHRRPETLWYLANTYLRREEPAKARPFLKEIAATDHPYARRAAAILPRLPAGAGPS